MKKLDDRFINFTYGSANAVTAEDIAYDATTSIKTKVDAGGTGNVTGAGSSTDKAITRFSSTSGTIIQNSSATISDAGTINIPTGQTYDINNTPHAHTGTYEPANANIQTHIGSSSNPHSTTYGQVGAEPANANIQNHIGSTSNPHSTTYGQVGAEPANANIQTHIGSTSNPHSVTKTQVNLGSVDNVQQLPMSYLDTDVTLSANSNSKVASQAATKSYADSLIAANGAMVFKGAIDCSGNPNYPAANIGHSYKASAAGKIGGASGVNVELGDLMICLADSTAGTQVQVGANWDIIQVNLDGAVIGPASSTDHAISRYNLTTGKVIQDSLATIDDTGTINIPTGQTYNINGSAHTHSYEPANANIQNHISSTSNPHSVTATQVSLGNVTNESKATMFSSPTFTGTVSGVTATHVGLGNVTNESKATMFSSPTFTGTVSGVTATHVGLGNVTNNAQVKKASGSIDHEVMRWNGTTGDSVVDTSSGVTISDTGVVNIPTGATYNINGTPHTHASTGPTKATGTVSSWTLSGGVYYSDFAHNLNTRPVMVQTFDSVSWAEVTPFDVELTSVNNARIWSADATASLSIIVIG